MSTYEGRWSTVKVELESGIAWVILNRPEKRNAMSPTLNREMVDVLETLEQDAEAGVLVITGAGESWTAGMDLKEYFREVDAGPEILQEKIRREASQWQWKLLRMYAKPTIAMVNGWCFGGLQPAGSVRPGHLCRRGDLRPVGNQLGHSARQPGQQSHGRHRRASSVAVLHHDR